LLPAARAVWCPSVQRSRLTQLRSAAHYSPVEAFCPK
jgi:hypothetical protein